jgi:hypothetical protein
LVFFVKTYLIPLSKSPKNPYFAQAVFTLYRKIVGKKSDTITYEAGNNQGITHGCTSARGG